MATPERESRTLEVLTKRLDVLRRLRESPAHKRDLVEELDQSRRTIDRAVNELQDVDLVERRDGGFAATVAGRLALDRLEAFQGELDDVVAAEAVVDPLPLDAPIDARAVAGGEALPASDPVPHRPVERFHDDLAGAERYRAVLPALDDPRHVRLLYEHVVTEGQPAELVVTPELFRALREEFPRRMAAMAESDGFDLFVGDAPPFALVLLDDGGTGGEDGPGGPADTTVYVVVFAEGGSSVHGVLVNETAPAVRWAEDRYAAARATADERTEALLPDADGGTPAVDADGGAVRALLGEPVSVALEREGFVRLGVPYFREEPVADPTTAWRAGLTVPEVHTGYAVERTLPPGEDREADGTDADDGRGDGPGADDGRAMTAALVDDLADGRDCAVVGPPGSGKSTVCKRVACEWYDADRGPVLYRESGRGRPFDSVDDLLLAVDAADGHALVVVEDAVRPEVDAIFDAVDHLSERDDVSALVDAREGEWRDPPGDPGDVSGFEVVHVPPLSDRDAERLVERFERTVDEGVDVPVDRLLEEVREEAATDDGAAPDAVLLLLHRLATYADPLADGETSLEAEVADVYDGLADDDLALDVAVLANALNAAGLGVDAGALYAVADPGEYEAVDASLERLERRVLFPLEDGTYRTVHEAWSVAFLAHVLDAEGEAAAAERFGRCASALLALADDSGQLDRIADHIGERPKLAAVADGPGNWADETAEAVYALGRERPKLAPLFGDGERDSVELPDACSAAVTTRRTMWLARMFVDGGDPDRTLEAVRRGLTAVPEDSRVACRLLGVRADAQVDRSEFEQARETARRQRELAADIDARDLEAEALRRLGEVAREQGEYERAGEYGRRGLELARELGVRRVEGDCLRTLGVAAYRQGEYERACEHYERSLEIARELGDREGEASSLGNLGLVAHSRGRFEQAREQIEQCLEIHRAAGNRRNEADSLNHLGVIVMEEGRYEQAHEYYERGLEIYRASGNRRGEAMCLGNLGLVAHYRGRLERAREYHERSLETARELGDRQGKADCLGNLGEVARDRGLYEQAREYHERSLEIKRDLGHRWGEAISLNNLGKVARRRGRYEQAREYHERSLEVRRDLDDREGEASSLGNLGDLAYRRGRFERAREHLELALDVADDVGDPEEVARARSLLGEIAGERGEFDAGREHHERALDALREVETPFETARVHLSRGRLALGGGDLDAARERAERARESFAEVGMGHFEARSRLLLGRVAAGADDPDGAREHFEAALQTFAEVGAPQDALTALRQLVETCREVGDDGAAEEWHRRARETLADAPDAVADEHREWVEALDDG